MFRPSDRVCVQNSSMVSSAKFGNLAVCEVYKKVTAVLFLMFAHMFVFFRLDSDVCLFMLTVTRGSGVTQFWPHPPTKRKSLHKGPNFPNLLNSQRPLVSYATAWGSLLTSA